MKLSAVTLTLTLGLLAAPVPAEAQKAGKVYRIGLLAPGTRAPKPTPIVEAFYQGLREFGWVESKNIAFEWRYAERKPERLPDLAAELVSLKVDVMVTLALQASLAAKRTTRTTPIVFMAGEAVRRGLVASHAHPGGNLTGISAVIPELSPKRLQLLKEAVPGISRVAVLWNAANPGKVLEWRTVQAAAQVMGLTLQSREIRGPDDFESAFDVMTRERPEALFTLDDPVTYGHRKQIVDFAAKSGLPAMYGLPAFVDAGGLMAYGASLPAIFHRLATFVHKILEGGKPADLPVEQPTKFDLVINLRTAKALGLTIPPSVLFQADSVIK